MSEPAPTYLIPSDPAIPAFEGRPVARHEIKISGVASMNSEENDIAVISVDDRVRIVGNYRVIRVNHVIDDKTGELIRQEIITPIDIEICPWDPKDPNDDGVVRAIRR